MKATFIGGGSPRASVEQKVWRLDPPLEHGRWNEDDEWVDASIRFVVTSASTTMSEPETYMFEAGADGPIANFQELPGSYRGGLDHELCLTYNGYEVIQ